MHGQCQSATVQSGIEEVTVYFWFPHVLLEVYFCSLAFILKGFLYMRDIPRTYIQFHHFQ